MTTPQTFHVVGFPCGADSGFTATGPSVNCLECLLRGGTAEALLTTFKVLTHRVHEYDTGLAQDPQRADLYRQQRSEVERELLRRLGGPQATG